MLDKLKDITTFIFDIDGVLTDGTILATETGEFLRSFNIKDGYAMQLAVKKGFKICIISGAKGVALERRFTNLGIADHYLGVDDKVAVFEAYIAQSNIAPSAILYMGDDIPDLKVMQLVGLPTCPNDAVPEIKAVSQYISPFNGGKCAVRDVIEKVLKVQQRWSDPSPSAKDSAK
ncbi:MAG: HAD-IIIA family hydrolase [Sphingobacteriales bacterium]|nr:MAG: HAD-IIIA family hydrolase [Sphingobacteriales bacterium]